MAGNPYSPGVGTRPPFLAGREQEIRQFEQILAGYPEKRRNLRITGLRGVGKTVLMKEYDRIARRHDWVVIRRDWSSRLCEETDFATTIADHLRDAVDALSVKARVKRSATTALEAISRVQVKIGEDLTLSSAPESHSPRNQCWRKGCGSPSPRSAASRVRKAEGLPCCTTRHTASTTGQRSINIPSARCFRRWWQRRTTMTIHCP